MHSASPCRCIAGCMPVGVCQYAPQPIGVCATTHIRHQGSHRGLTSGGGKHGRHLTHCRQARPAFLLLHDIHTACTRSTGPHTPISSRPQPSFSPYSRPTPCQNRSPRSLPSSPRCCAPSVTTCRTAWGRRTSGGDTCGTRCTRRWVPDVCVLAVHGGISYTLGCIID